MGGHISQLLKRESKIQAFKPSADSYETSLMNRLDLIDNNIGVLSETSTDDDIKEIAAKLARRIEFDLSMVHKVGVPIFISVMKHYCNEYSVRYPEEHVLESIVARLIDAEWWLRKLRVSHLRACEFKSLSDGKVHKGAAMYCSDETLEKRREQSKRNKEILDKVSIMNESGYKMTLSDAAAVGMANPFNRVSELITRTKGFGELADKYKHLCIFLTITAPSRFHAINHDGKVNKKYNQSTPAETQKYLTKQWAKCRARLAREGVRFYGLRVVEPHHDGTPHWHASIWLKDERDFRKLRRAVKDYFHRAKECGALKNRLKFKRCDSRGAVGYMLKYILKNMRSHGIEGEQSDEGNIRSDDSAERVEAWATAWGIRQFQQVGGHSVTVWRELRRVDEQEIQSRQFATGDSLVVLMDAWRAAQKMGDKKANYADFIEAMGGLETKPRDSRVKLQDEYLVNEGKYGESIKHVINGLIDMTVNFAVKNNRQEWVRV